MKPPRHATGPAAGPAAQAAPRAEADGAAARSEFLDLRGLSPPQPLVTILRRLQSLDDALDLVVCLDRDPVMLYPELAELGREAVPEPGDGVRLRLRRVRSP
jgi:hypothetical protein